MTGSYTAPAGTTWIFGTDGSTVGTKKARPEFFTNGWSQKLNFGACTIYGITAKVNSGGLLYWDGTNTLVNCGQTFEFSAVNIDGSARGIVLSGAFISDTDVTIKMTRNSGSVDAASAHAISGDFTNFKGGISLEDGSTAARLNGLELTSESAFGSTDVERTDYLSIGNFTRWTIGNDVVQRATKGITLDLSESETNAMYAAEGASWTLTAPVTTKNGTGTLAKTGAGSVTLAGKIDVPSLDVKEGTLVIDSAATFEQQTTLTIRSGATVVTRQGNAIPNVTLVKEDGAVFSLDFTVPYADGATTALDYSSLSEAAWTGMDKPLPLKLSAEIAHPVNAELRLPMIKLPSSLGAKATDFSDTTGKTYGLPVTSFEVASDGSDCDVVYLVARPVVYLTAESSKTRKGIVYLNEANQTDSAGAEFATWSDGLAAHEGADYVVANGSATVTGEWWNGGLWTFPGESLTYLGGKFATKAQTNVFKRVTFYDKTLVHPQGYASGDCRHIVLGECNFASGVVSNLVYTETVSQGNKSRRVVDFAGKLTGEGTLLYSGSLDGQVARISGDGTSFVGAIKNAVTGTDTVPAFVECADLNKLLAPRTVFNNQALNAAGNFSGFQVSEDCTFADNGFALMLSGYCSMISVAEGKTLTMSGKMVLAPAQTCKYGSGTLALGGTTCFSADARETPEQVTVGGNSYTFQLRGGWVKPVAWNDGRAYSRIRFKAVEEGAGLSFDAEPTDADVKKYGMRLVYDDSITFASDAMALPIRIDLPETLPLVKGCRKVTSRIAVPVLTVTDACAETIKDRLTVVKNYRSAKAAITSAAADGLDGYTTFTVTLEPQGLLFVIR